MPLEGSVFLALWNDFDPSRDAEYETWHSFEHVPERVGVSGMRRGRRYRAAERSFDRFFTLYEVQDDAVLTSAPYLDLVQHPTEWSRDMRPHFRNVRRMPCRTLISVGSGTGRHVATARLCLPRAPDEGEIEGLARLAAPAGEGASTTAFHAGLVIEALSDYPVFNGRQSADGAEAGTMALVVEAETREAAETAARRACAWMEHAVDGAATLALSSYDLVLAVSHDELGPIPNGRLPPRPDLRAPARLNERASA